jgi:hypothetical protein
MDGIGDTARYPAARTVPLPYVELVLGLAWFTVGTSALPVGVGTVVLAAGLIAAGALGAAIRSRQGRGIPLPRGGRGRLFALTFTAVGLIAGATAGLRLTPFGELAIPAACVICGAGLVPGSRLLEARSLLAVGAALMLVGAGGAVLALDSGGDLYPRGVVGLVAGVLLAAAGAVRTGVFGHLRARARR